MFYRVFPSFSMLSTVTQSFSMFPELLIEFSFIFWDFPQQQCINSCSIRESKEYASIMIHFYSYHGVYEGKWITLCIVLNLNFWFFLSVLFALTPTKAWLTHARMGQCQQHYFLIFEKFAPHKSTHRSRKFAFWDEKTFSYMHSCIPEPENSNFMGEEFVLLFLTRR